MFDYALVTNNPLIKNKCPSATVIEGSPYRVYLFCRDLIHKGWSLHTHPLTGNLRQNRQPFRTVILRWEGTLIDLISLQEMEHAIGLARPHSDFNPYKIEIPDKIREDLQFMDYILLEDELKKLGIFGM